MGRVIREAVPADIPALVGMGRDFLSEVPVDVPFDPEYLRVSFADMISRGEYLVLVLEVDGVVAGGLLAALARSIWAPVAYAVEQVMWIDPAHRGPHALRLIRAYTAWAREMGCAYASFAVLQSQGIGPLLQRAGYGPAENIFTTKVL